MVQIPNRKLYSAKEFSQLLGITPKTLRRLVKDELIPQPTRLGGQQRWYATDVHRVISKEDEHDE